jgi:hypothetical protein
MLKSLNLIRAVYHSDIEAENARIEERAPKIWENEEAQC